MTYKALARFLKDETEVWSQNAWDHVPPPDDQQDIIDASLKKQRSAPVPEEEHVKYNKHPSRHW
jgi:tRNAThr (cytosine32-N3)-methyltransferase